MPPMHLEIERKFLLRHVPQIPAGADIWRIEQGYFAPPNMGRLRRITRSDGSIICTHTVKHGTGISRQESEQTISNEEFARQWPLTEGRRLNKVRYRVRCDSDAHHCTWEIDDFTPFKLVLAEVELASAEQIATPPAWLAPIIVKEVTDDPAFTNAAIASRLNAARKEES